MYYAVSIHNYCFADTFFNAKNHPKYMSYFVKCIKIYCSSIKKTLLVKIFPQL